MNKKYILKRDIIIKAGTEFGPTPTYTSYGDDNIMALFDLGPDSCGRIIYGGLRDDPKAAEWFEEVKK